MSAFLLILAAAKMATEVLDAWLRQQKTIAMKVERPVSQRNQLLVVFQCDMILHQSHRWFNVSEAS